MPIDIEAGTVMVRSGLLMPGAICMPTDSYSRQWQIVTGLNAAGVERSVQAGGWHFFCAAGSVRAFAFGQREGKNARRAVNSILSQIEDENFNSVEVTEISTKHFFGIPYLSVCANARHIQETNQLQNPSARRLAQHEADWAGK